MSGKPITGSQDDDKVQKEPLPTDSEVTKKDRILVSFCIPTFNRSELVRQCVMEVLRIDSPLIEVLVVNNDSPDDTDRVIRAFRDGRISYYKNETNIGSAMNVVRAITKAKGEWVFLMSDEDRVNVESVNDIIKDLEAKDRSEVAVILGNVKRYDGSYLFKYKNKTFAKGDEAVCGVGFTHHYMSGIMMNKKHIDADQLQKYSPEDGIYPHINLFTRACVSGGAMTMDKEVCTAGCYEGRKSFVEKPNNKFYLHPDNRFEQFKTFSRMADQIVIDRDRKLGLFVRLYFDHLSMSTFNWEHVIRTEAIRDHFGVDMETMFDFRAEVKKFDFRARGFLDEIIEDPMFRKDLDKAISRRMFRFRLLRTYSILPNPLKRIVRFAHSKTVRK